MTQPQRVIYLPPGVVPGPTAAPAVANNGVPFDRAFFEGILPQAVQSFCTQTGCPLPVVELMTIDGTTHYVNGISGVADQWVALQTSNDNHARPVHVFLPYNTIFRIEIHPEPDNGGGHLGFVLSSTETPPTAIPSAPVPVNEKQPATRAKSEKK